MVPTVARKATALTDVTQSDVGGHARASASEHPSQFPAWAALRPIAWIMIGLGAFRTFADPDLWGHVRFGLDILQAGQLSTHDPYSFTQDVPWTNHEWLSELTAGWAYAHGGSAGLIALKAALTLSSSLLMAGALRDARDEWRWGPLALGAMGALPISYTVRPQLWTLFLMLALCRLLTAPPRYLWGIPALFLLWANVHGGWIVGLSVLAAWSVCALLDRAGIEPRTLVTVLILSALATLVNPYGIGLWKFVLATVRLSRGEIQEWLPIWRDTPSSWILWTCGVGFILLVCQRGAARPPLRHLAVAIMLMTASSWVNRIVPLSVPAAVVLLAPSIERQRRRPDPIPLARTAVDSGITLVTVGFVAYASLFNGCIEVTGDWVPDATAAASLRASDARGRIVTWFDWGEYAIWHLSPKLKVSFDGRRETIYSDRTIQTQFSIARGDAAGLAALQQMSPDYVWLPNARSAATKDWLKRNGYRIDVDTPLSFVAVRQAIHPLQLAKPDARVVRCFP